MHSASAVACVFVGMMASTTAAQPAVPVRDLAKIDAKATRQFGNIFSVRQLPGGKVLVNDGVWHQLVVLDERLASPKIIVDSVAEGGQSYGTRASPLIPHLGDSTFFVDEASLTLVLIDPGGKVVRVVAPPHPSDVRQLMRSAGGIDAKGNLVYRGEFNTRRTIRSATGEYRTTIFPDTAPIVRANFETRKVDTLAAVRLQPSVEPEEVKDVDGKMAYKLTMNPLLLIDEWAVLSDGTVAIVRGHDYHVDLIGLDGKTVAAPKLPFDFKMLKDADKQRMLDSVKADEARRRESIRPESGPRIPSREGPSRITQASPRTLYEFVPFSEMPDYYPPIRRGAVKSDADGNLWILPTTSAQSTSGELIYDVVNNRGVMTERVRIPAGRSVAGFGRGGVVYLMSKDAANLWTLERTRVVNR